MVARLGLRILLAEDETLIAMTLSDVLEAEGHTVTVKGDGAAALSYARLGLGTFDMLVTDLNMPLLTGEDLIRAVRQVQPELPIVVVTGAPPDGGLETLLQLGGTGLMLLLEKPIDFNELIAAVERLRPRPEMANGGR